MGGGRGLCRVCLPSVGTSPTQGSTTPNTLDASQGPVYGALRDGAWGPGGRLAPRLASLKGVESPWSLLPQCREQAGRSQWQGPGGRKPRAGGLAPTTRATATGGTDRTCAARDAGGRRGSVLTSGSAPGSPCRLHRGVWTPPSGALPGTSQISAPHDARRVPLAPAALPC